VEIIQVGRKSESFNRALDVFLDMRGGVGDSSSLTSEGDDATFRGNYSKLSAFNLFQYNTWDECLKLTENLIANIVLPDKITKKLLIHTSLIDNLCIQLEPYF
jgi:hypothetical protein